MSSCLSGGGRTYGLELDIVKSAAAAAAAVSRSSSHSSSSSPSSTLSEASNSPLAISTKRPRTPRKRPNQTYNEAAALLSTAYPAVFPARALRSSRGSPRPRDSFFESPELLPPFPPLSDAGFLLRDPPLAALTSHPEPKKLNSLRATSVCRSPPGIDFRDESSPAVVDDDDFDAESMLDEEVEEGMDSIMGVNLESENGNKSGEVSGRINPYLGSLMMFGLGGRFEFGFGLGLAGGSIRRALRCADDWDWWRSPTVAIRDIVPKFKKLSAASEKKKKKKKVEEKDKELEDTTIASAATTTSSLQENSLPNLGLKLDYDDILKAWSDRGCPYSDGPPESPESLARLAQIDLSSEVANGGGLREAIVQRYKEKRRTRLFSKKIRYQVRKVNADRRPRMKGRFVRKPSLLRETIEEESP